MHRRVIQTAAVVTMATALFITGCTSQASNIGVAKDKENNIVDTGFTVSSAGSYDSADTAVVMSVDSLNRGVTFMNMEAGRQYTLYYDGTTYIKDKYGGPMTISQIEPGDVVDVNFLKGKRKIASIQISPDAWVYEDIDNYDLGGINKTAGIGSSTYSLPDEAVVLSEGKRVEVMDIVSQDRISVRGVGHKIYSINVDKGHGYLRLKNDQALIGGWIEVGNTIIREITSDMLLVVPEGSYRVFLSKDGISSQKDIVVARNKEVVLDVGDLEVLQDKTGKILLSVTPADAAVEIDGKPVITDSAVELPYGIHQVHLEAEGYDSLTKYIQVGSEYAQISFTLERSRELQEEDSISQNQLEPQKDTDDGEPVGDDVVSPSTGNRVYIDAPKDVEVYVDSNYIGISPVSFKKTVGSHTVTLRKSGYKTRSYTVYLYNDGEDITYSFEDLEKENSTVSGNDINSSQSSSQSSSTVSGNESTSNWVHISRPENVKVYLDENYIGISPVGFRKITGSHTLTLRQNGYVSQSYTIFLYNDGEDVTYEFDPLEEEKKPGENDGTVSGNDINSSKNSSQDSSGGDGGKSPEPEE